MPRGDTRTPFVETEALLAVLDKDEARLMELLCDCTDRELYELRRACQTLEQACVGVVEANEREIARTTALLLLPIDELKKRSCESPGRRS